MDPDLTQKIMDQCAIIEILQELLREKEELLKIYREHIKVNKRIIEQLQKDEYHINLN